MSSARALTLEGQASNLKVQDFHCPLLLLHVAGKQSRHSNTGSGASTTRSTGDGRILESGTPISHAASQSLRRVGALMNVSLWLEEEAGWQTENSLGLLGGKPSVKSSELNHIQVTNDIFCGAAPAIHNQRMAPVTGSSDLPALRRCSHTPLPALVKGHPWASTPSRGRAATVQSS